MAWVPDVKYRSRPGALSDPATDPAARLLFEDGADETGPRGRLLLLEGGCGALPAKYAPAFAEVVCQNGVYPDHASSLDTISANGITNVTCLLGDIPRAGAASRSAAEDWPDGFRFPEGHFDQVMFRLGRGTALVNAALIEAFALLRTGGSLTVAGHNREGVKSFAKRAEALFGNGNMLGMKASCRLMRFRKEAERPASPLPDPHYFQPVRLLLQMPGAAPAIEYLSKPGIFAYRETDPATALLARALPGCGGLSVLDMGCGSGVLSLAAFKLGAAQVTAADMSAVAVACAERNFRDHGFPGKAVCTYLAEGLEGPFDMILSNPPFHRGSETDYALPAKVLDALQPMLKPGGTLLLVANQFLNYAGEGAKRFAKVEILVREKGYQVFRMG
jgi:16S rRNA (guanine1207-N2)-methyltransferase